MLVLPFGASAQPLAPSEGALLQRALYGRQALDWLSEDARCAAKFGDVLLFGALAECEYCAFDCSAGALVNVVFASYSAPKLPRDEHFRQPVQVYFFEGFRLLKFRFRRQTAVTHLSQLLYLRAAAFCEPYDLVPVAAETDGEKLLVSRYRRGHSAAPRWAFSDELALQRLREVHETFQNSDALGKRITLTGDDELLRRYGLTERSTSLGKLLRTLRNAISHALDDADNSWTQLRAEAEAIYPQLFTDISRIK